MIMRSAGNERGGAGRGPQHDQRLVVAAEAPTQKTPQTFRLSRSDTCDNLRWSFVFFPGRVAGWRLILQAA